MNKELELTIEEIHQGTIDILKKIIEICNTINVDYYLMYGSLIGAVRHKGFIPWDDDCDIVMMRSDYEKFIAYCNEREDEIKPFRVFNRQNTKGYPFNIARFCDTRYKMVSDVAPDAGMGMFIDIYPLDTVKEAKPSKLLLFRKKLLMILVFECYYKQTSEDKNSFVKRIGRRALRAVAKLFGAEFWLNRLERLKNKYSDANGEYATCLVWDDHKHYKKGFFSSYVMLKFENLEVKVPKEYDTILRMWYGDYMKLPPVEKRGSTHNYKLFRKI